MLSFSSLPPGAARRPSYGRSLPLRNSFHLISIHFLFIFFSFSFHFLFISFHVFLFLEVKSSETAFQFPHVRFAELGEILSLTRPAVILAGPAMLDTGRDQKEKNVLKNFN